MTAIILNVGGTESGRQLITRVLKGEGFDVREASSGQEALEKAGECPDLIVLDVHLPDLSGLEVCRRIKSDPETSGISVLQLSDTSSEQDRVTSLDAGAEAYLTHPITPEVLRATVRALLRARTAESKLRQELRAWQFTFDSVGYSVCLIDAEGRVQQANKATSELAGKPVDQIAGLHYTKAFDTLTRPPEGWPLERALLSGKPESNEMQLDNRWLRVTANPFTDERGKYAGVVMTVTDVTDRKEREQDRERLLGQVESERARLWAILEQMPAGVIVAEAPSEEPVFVSSRVREILRYSQLPATIAAKTTVLKGRHPDGRPYSAEDWPLIRSIRSGEVVMDEEIEVERGDGTRAMILASSAPLLDRAGYIVGGVVAFQDVTERRQLAQQLRQSQKMEAVGRLAGGVAHDFNNLLTIVSGYGQMVLDSLSENDPLRRDLEAIMEAATRATALTKQLLTFSRRQVVQPKVMDLNRLVSRMNRMLRRVIGEDMDFKTSLKAEPSRIKADAGQIEQVIMNLAVNARDAMPTGGKLLINTSSVELPKDAPGSELTLPAGRYVKLSVTDTGKGMDAETMSHVFEPFFTTKGKGKGTGLGLSTVYGIVKQAGGDITVESEPGKGSTFSLYFPAAGQVAQKSSESSRLRVKKGSETILLVEDEPDVRTLAREMLRRQGYTVLEAGNGVEALQVWQERSEEVDMLLTDVIMPHMSGHELAEQLKSMRPGLKVLYMSGYTGDVIARHGVVSTKVEFLQKPFTSDVLAEKLRAVLDS